jgi:hypothetical protein
MNTANTNNSPANIVLFLLPLLVIILERRSIITEKAQGFILSAKAAGNIIPKNLHLLLVIGSLSSSSTEAEPEISSWFISPQFK